MHERYIFDGLALTLCAMPLARRYVASTGILSLTLLVNLLYSLRYLAVVTQGAPRVNSADMWGAFDHAVSFVNVATFFWLAYSYLGGTAGEPARELPRIAPIARRFLAKVRTSFVPSEGTASFAWPLDYVVCGALTAASFAILYVRFWFPPEKIFDEVYFARAAEEYLHRQYIYENTHPPVTKLLITLSTVLFGDNSYGWRFLDVVFGAVAVWLLYALLKRVTGSTLFSAYGAALFMCDGMHFVQSRIATPESFVVCFSLATVYTFYRYWIAVQGGAEPLRAEHVWLKPASAAAGCIATSAAIVALRFPNESFAAKAIVIVCGAGGLYLVYRLFVEPRMERSPIAIGSRALWLGLFAASIALLVASKWYGVMAFGVALVIVMRNPRRFAADVMLAAVVFVVGSIYFASYTPQFIGLSDSPGGAPRAYTLTDVVNMQYDAFQYHDHLRATHPYQSRWWQWPLDLRPILYYAKYGKDGQTPTAAMIYTLPNPLILWLGLATVPFIAFLGFVERKRGYVLIVLTYAAQWLPWIGSPRISFNYHFYVDIPLICACTAIVMQRVWSASRGSKFETPARAVIVAYAICVALAFVYFYPILSGSTIPSAAWMQRMWLRTWV
jgi:dolichyl-phosphate-mannose--protein O-mannosyl transferase